MAAKILIADDEPNIVTMIQRYAEREGYAVTGVSDGRAAIEACRNAAFDVIILDVMMPDTDGFTACRKIREFADTPIIMLSARGTEYDKLHGFEVGVDDYVTKPFSPKELMARIKVVSERRQKRANEKYVFDTLVIDVDGRSVTIDGEKVMLTPKELDLLIYLVQNRNIALGREKILSAVWDSDYYGDDRTVDTHIKMLRRSLGPYRDYVVTVRGMGYKFEA